jgi:hypothetical protein
MENRNGGANRRLAGGEWRVVLTSALGKEMVVGEKSPANVSFYRGRRERPLSCTSVLDSRRLAGPVGTQRA